MASSTKVWPRQPAPCDADRRVEEGEDERAATLILSLILCFIVRIDAGTRYRSIISDVSPRPSFGTPNVQGKVYLSLRQFRMFSIAQYALHLLRYLSFLPN